MRVIRNGISVELSPIEQWMVKSNLQTIASGVHAEEIIRILRHNGYRRVAKALQEVVRGE